MKIEYSQKFLKKLKKGPEKIKEFFYERLELFEIDKNNPLLNIHSLSGKYKGCESINITGNWRAIFISEDNYKKVTFYFIGTHSKLYG
jgi:addiction module RelE/StbE family toxin